MCNILNIIKVIDPCFNIVINFLSKILFNVNLVIIKHTPTMSGNAKINKAIIFRLLRNELLMPI